MASSNFLSKTESTLYLIITFIGDMVRTFIDFTFYPKKIEKHIEITPHQDIHLTNKKYQGPLSYLFVFTILCAIYGYWATQSELAKNILLKDEIFKPFINILDKVWQYVSALDTSKLFIIILPLIAFTVLYSLSLTISSRILKMKSLFKLNLYISSYFFGSYLFLHGLLFSYTMAIGSLFKSLSTNLLLSIVLVWHLFIIVLIIKIFHSFFIIIKIKIAQSVLSSFVLILFSTIIFIVFFIPIGLLIFPFLAI